jgi:hypothetical protein
MIEKIMMLAYRFEHENNSDFGSGRCISPLSAVFVVSSSNHRHYANAEKGNWQKKAGIKVAIRLKPAPDLRL